MKKFAEKVDDSDFGHVQFEEIRKNPVGDVQPAMKFLASKFGKETGESPLSEDEAGIVEASGVTRKMVKKKRDYRGFPGGAVVENLPANAGDTGSSPGLGRSHMPRSN